MFQNEIKFINDFTLNKIKNLGTLFTIDKLLTADFHPAIKKYIEAEIDYLIFDDRRKLLQNSIFDYSGAKISNYFNLISDEIKKSKKVTFEEIQKLVLQAVSFNANYVVRPNWSITKLVYGNNKSVTVDELEMMFNYVHYYDYIKNIFSSYLSKRKLVNISITEFELILNKIDRELFNANKEKLIDNALFTVADFFSVGGLNKSNVSVEAVENYLKEKNLIDQLIRIKRAFPGDSKKTYSIEDIRKVIYSTSPIEISEKNKDEKAEELAEETGKEVEPQEVEKEEELEIIESPTDGIFVDSEEKPMEDSEKEKPEKVQEEESAVEIEVSSEKVEEKVEEEILDESKEEELTITEELLENLTEADSEENEELKLLSEKEEEEILAFYDKEFSDEEKEPEIKSIDDTLKELEEQMGKALDEKTNLSDEIEIEEVTDFDLADQQQKINFSEKDENKTESEAKDEIHFKDNETQELPIIEQEDYKPTRENDIFSYLTEREIDKIVEGVFNSDSEDFANTVEKISDCNTYEEATDILKAVFNSYKVGEFSKEAVLFTNAVARYFSQE